MNTREAPATLIPARSANLVAEKDAIILMTAKAVGKNWLTALGGAINSAWETAGNWTRGTPTASKNAIVNVSGLTKTATVSEDQGGFVRVLNKAVNDLEGTANRVP